MRRDLRLQVFTAETKDGKYIGKAVVLDNKGNQTEFNYNDKFSSRYDCALYIEKKVGRMLNDAGLSAISRHVEFE